MHMLRASNFYNQCSKQFVLCYFLMLCLKQKGGRGQTSEKKSTGKRGVSGEAREKGTVRSDPTFIALELEYTSTYCSEKRSCHI